MSVTKVMIGAFCALLAGIVVEGAKGTETAADQAASRTVTTPPKVAALRSSARW
jgi:hypothetical protein